MKKHLPIVIPLLFILSLSGCGAYKTQEGAVITPSPSVMAVATSASATTPTITPISIEGATMLNQPLAHQDGEWIYYCTPFDDLNAICRTNDCFKTQTLLTQANSPRLVTISDEWIYYLAFNDDNYDSLYRIKTDGTKQECLRDNIDEMPINFIYNDGWIYYNLLLLVSTETTETDYGTATNSSYRLGPGLYRLSLSGEQNELISSSSLWKIALFDNNVYYSNADDNGYLYEMSTDGSNPRKVAEINSLFYNTEAFLCLADNKTLYYFQNTGVINSPINAFSLEDHSTKQIAIGFYMTVKATEDWLFYTAVENDYTDQGVDLVGAMYVAKKDGSESKLIFDIRNLVDYTVIDGTIIFSYFERVGNDKIFHMAYSDINGNLVEIPFSSIPVPETTG